MISPTIQNPEEEEHSNRVEVEEAMVKHSLTIQKERIKEDQDIVEALDNKIPIIVTIE